MPVPTTQRRPNILLIVTDQHRADHLGCYGNTILKTPHIDALAARGVKADRFYVANTTCMSNRATLMTGRMPSLHGVVHNGINLDRRHTTFVELLRDAGYATALIGKSHLQAFGYDSPAKRAWVNPAGASAPAQDLRDARKDQRCGAGYTNEWTPDWKAGQRSGVETPYYGFSHVDLCTLHGDQVQADYANWLASQHAEPDSLRGRENAIADPRYCAPQSWRTRVPEELYPSAYIGGKTCEWLEAHAAHHPGQAFFLQCSFPDPHHPFTPPGKYWDKYDPEDIPLPATFGKTPRSELVERIHAYTKNGGDREGTAAFAVSERECREIIALTYGMISMIDDQVGNIMATLERLGMDEDTVVIFTSDHGDFMGDFGVMLKGPIHHQGVVRVPFIWRDCAQAPICDARELAVVAGTIDIARTILDRAGIAPYNGIQGLSLMPWIRSSEVQAPDRSGIVIESEAVKVPEGGRTRMRLRSLLTQGRRLTLSGEPKLCELYDLEADPLEQHNLWAEPRWQVERDRLIQQFFLEQLSLGDESPLPAAVA